MNLPAHIFTADADKALARVVSEVPHDKLFVVMPASCREFFSPLLKSFTPSLLIDDREEEKTLANLEKILAAMADAFLTRRSLLVAVGGGVTTDIVGLAAALYMRGIRYVNLPTTLLAMVDASSGGKTAVDFHGIKNLIGAFHAPLTTIICTDFLHTLPPRQLLSGYAEMLKHSLLSEEKPVLLSEVAVENLSEEVEKSVIFKHKITEADPREQGLRRILNLGHTAGHAFEALALARGSEVTHGEAVAQGLVTALVLSVLKCRFPSPQMQGIAAYVAENFPPIPFTCNDYPELLRLMAHDKKNVAVAQEPTDAVFSFVLLEEPGRPVTEVPVSSKEVEEALDITRDLLHL